MSLANKTFSIFKRDLVLLFTNLLTGIVVARALGPASLGIWTVLALVLAYSEAFGRTKADLAAVYFLGKKMHHHGDLLFNLNVIAWCSSGLIIALALWQFDLIYEWLFKNAVGNYRLELQALLLQIPMQFLLLNYTYFHIAEENVIIYNRIILIKACVNSVCSLLLLVCTSLGLWSVIFATLFGTGSALLYGWSAVDRNSCVRGRLNLPMCLAMLRYGASFILAISLVSYSRPAPSCWPCIIFCQPPWDCWLKVKLWEDC